MSNCLLAWPDRCVPSGYTPTWSGGSWSLALTNLSDPSLATYARSLNATTANTTFDIDLGVVRDLRVFAIPDHNFSADATIRVKVSTVMNFSTTVADTGALTVWGRYYPTGVLPSGHESYSDGKLTAEARVGLRAGWWHALNTSVQGRYVRVEMTDTANSDGWVQLNRFICAPAWSPNVNMSTGATISWLSDTDSVKTLGGPTWYDRRSARRVCSFTLEALTPAQAMTYPFEIQRILGIDGELFFVFDPSDTDLLLKQRSFLATLRQLNPIEYPYATALRTAFELVEIL